jgi:hypothetical protein
MSRYLGARSLILNNAANTLGEQYGLNYSRREALKRFAAGAVALGASSITLEHAGVLPKGFGPQILSATSAQTPTNHRLSSVAAYYTPDRFRHAMVATSSGKLHEIFYRPDVGKGIAYLACFDSINRIDGFFASDSKHQIEIVATSDGDVHEIFFRPNDIHYTNQPLGTFAGIVDITAFQALDDNSRIVVVATSDGNIQEIFYHPSIGIHLTRPSLAQFGGIVAIAGFFAEDDESRIVIVATNDGNVHEIFYRPSFGVHVSQPPLVNLPGIVDIGAFYAEDDKSRIVIVATSDGNVREIFYNPSIGVHLTQPPLAKISDLRSVAAFYAKDDHSRIVIAGTDDGTVHEIFYGPSIGVHLTQPQLASFPLPIPYFEDVSPDPTNVDPGTATGLKSTSSSGRVIGVAGGIAALYAMVEKAGVWKSANGGSWVQLSAAPGGGSLEGPQIAVDPGNGNHLAVATASGGWESADGGLTWNKAFDPKTVGCSSAKASAVIFAQDGTLFVGYSCGIAHRPPSSSTFIVFSTTADVRAFAVSDTRFFARTPRALFVSAAASASVNWTGPFVAPISMQFDFLSTFSVAAFDTFAFLPFSTSGAVQTSPCGLCGADVKVAVFNANTGTWSTQSVDFGGCHACDGTGLGGRKFIKSFIRNPVTLPNSVGQRVQIFYGVGQEVYQAKGLNSAGTFAGWNRIVDTFASGALNWSRLSVQKFRVDKWSLCRG